MAPNLTGTARTAEQTQADFVEWEKEINIRGERLAPAQYEHLGELRSIIRVPRPERAWTGTISVARRIHTDFTSEELRGALGARNLHPYYVEASSQGRARCIDGRCICNYATDESLRDRPLGPQLPGGTSTSAMCGRVADTEPLESDYDASTEDDELNENTFMNDIENFQTLLDAMMWKAGGHIDDHAPEGRTGCGAIDRLPEIVARITSPEAQMQLRGLTKALLGDSYNEAMLNELLGRFMMIEGNADTYFARGDDGNYLYLNAAIDRLKEKDGVAQLVGPHNEVAMVINLVPNTTFHRDEFAIDNDNVMQVFNYDLWRSIELAGQIPNLHHKDEDLTDGQAQNLSDRFLTTRVMFAVATAMVLTDGTLELIVRSEA